MSSKSRKNYSVAAMLFRVNHMLRYSTCSPDQRRGMMGMMETVLHNTGNYIGFAYLRTVPAGHAVGIHEVPDMATATQDDLFHDTDNTRVCYGVANAIRADYQEWQDVQDRDVEKCRAGGCVDAEKWLCTQIGA